MNKQEKKAFKELKKATDEAIEDISMNTLDFASYEKYYQKYKTLKTKTKTSEKPEHRNMFKTFAISLALALKDASVILITDTDETSYNQSQKELNEDLSIARKVKA